MIHFYLEYFFLIIQHTGEAPPSSSTSKLYPRADSKTKLFDDDDFDLIIPKNKKVFLGIISFGFIFIFHDRNYFHIIYYVYLI